MSNVVPLTSARSRLKREKPDAVEVQMDFGKWAVARFTGSRFRFRTYHEDEATARSVAQNLVNGGMRWRA